MDSLPPSSFGKIGKSGRLPMIEATQDQRMPDAKVVAGPARGLARSDAGKTGPGA